MKYSFIIPVFNRPDEVDELLASLCEQTLKDFEVIVVEDGSSVPCRDIVEGYTDRIDAHYYLKPNSGPGQTRNYGVERARGEYVLILDSDVVLPTGYLEAVEAELTLHPCDAFGGPDRAHESFTPMQKAINYAMTSFFTTGGIRGGKKKMDKFYPRSFNMGVRKDIYQKLNGFSKMRFGEDIDFSTRIFENGYQARLFPTAWVWHKRRTDLRKFFKQVHNSGIARINLTKRHPGTLKLVHLLPAIFTIGVTLLTLLIIIGLAMIIMGNITGCSATCPIHAHPVSLVEIGKLFIYLGLFPLLLYSLIIFVDSSIQNRSIGVGGRSIAAAFVQLTGYGSGFIRAWWQRGVLGRGEFEAFKKNFYK